MNLNDSTQFIDLGLNIKTPESFESEHICVLPYGFK